MTKRFNRFARQLDWNLLRTFLVIAEEKNLTRAAERLFLCQPTISGALRRLEERMGCRLAARGPGHFRLTEAGRELYEHCLEIDRAVANISEITRKGDREITGPVRIRTISGVSCEALDSAIADFSRDHPTAQFEVSVGHSRDNVAAVIEEETPIGVSLFCQVASNVEYRLVGQERFDLYCGPQYLINSRNPMSEPLRDASWVEFACERTGNRLHPLAALKRSRGIGDRVAAIAESAEELRTLLRHGVGIGFLPCHMADPDVRDGRLRRIERDFEAPQVEIFIATNRQMAVGPAESAFREQLARRLN